MPTLSPNEQFQALNVLDYLTDLFSSGFKNHYTREDVLVILDCVRSDNDLFDPDVVIAQQIATSDIPEMEE